MVVACTHGRRDVRGGLRRPVAWRRASVPVAGRGHQPRRAQRGGAGGAGARAGQPGAGGLVPGGPDLGQRPARVGAGRRAVRHGPLPSAGQHQERRHSWQALRDPPVHIPYGTADCPAAACVSHLRFATPAVGYLFGPALYQTSDGGRTWQRVPSRPVESLEPSAGTVVRVVYDHGGCPGPCDRVVQETSAGSGAWHTLLRLPADSAAFSVAGQLVRQGAVAMYLTLYGHMAGGAGSAHALILSSADAGLTWQQDPDPCGGTGASEHDAIDMAAAPGGFAAVLCVPRFSTGSTFVVTSADHGASWGSPRPVPGGARHGLTLITTAGPANLMLGTAVDSGQGLLPFRLVTSMDGGLHWSTEVTGTTQINPETPGASFLGFEDATVGRWISGPHDIWTTHDAGQHWHERAFP